MRTFNFSTFFKIINLCLIIVAFSACQTRRIDYQELSAPMEIETPSSRSIKERHYKIALLLPLSGVHSALGESLRQAAEMSLFDTTDSSMQLIPLDTKGTPQGATQAASSALEKNVDLILGPVFAPEARAVKSILGSSPVPVICYSTDLTLAEPGFFVFGFDVVEQIRSVLQYAASKDIHSVVAVLPNNQYGQVVEQELNSFQSPSSLRIEKIFKYDDAERNFSNIANQITAAGVQAIFIPEGSAQLTTILSSLAYHGIDLKKYQLLGTGQWDHPQVLYHKGAEGAWFASPSMEDRTGFEERFRKTYGNDPHRLATLAYDSISMAAMVIRLHPRDPFITASLTHNRGFVGTDGLFRLLRNGDTERSLAIFEVKSGSIQVIQPSTRAF